MGMYAQQLQSAFRENQTIGCVLKAEEIVVRHKEIINCLKTQLKENCT